MPYDSFHGLPGLLADSLPDKFGTKLISSYLAAQGRSADDLSAVEKLLYVGKRGMGALEYQPQQDYARQTDTTIDLNALVEIATKVLSDRENLHIQENKTAMQQIINIGTSAGGARAKVVIAWNPMTHDIRSGQIIAGDGYEYWLIKFDGVAGNKDHGKKDDDPQYTRIEYAYSLLAKECGIIMEESQLFEESGRYHFMTKRFDRTEKGEKLHMQSLGAIAHFDFNAPGAHSYEEASKIMVKLGLSQREIEQFFRRMVFNVVARNQDDHVKNISFLMDKTGQWRLAPAYDITYSNDPNNYWLSKHQMSINGKLEAINHEDLLYSARSMNISKAKANRIIEETSYRVHNHWEKAAEQAFLNERTMNFIKDNFVGERQC